MSDTSVEVPNMFDLTGGQIMTITTAEVFNSIDAATMTKADRLALIDLLQRAFEAAERNPYPVDSDYFSCCHAIGRHAQTCAGSSR